MKVLPVHLCSLTLASVSKEGYRLDMFFCGPLLNVLLWSFFNQTLTGGDNDLNGYQAVNFEQEEKSDKG